MTLNPSLCTLLVVVSGTAGLLAAGASAGAAAVPAGKAEAGSTPVASVQPNRITLRTSASAVRSNHRTLIARGSLPAGAQLTVRFSKGRKQLAIRRSRPKGGTYRSTLSIAGAATGTYRVRVSARTPRGSVLRATATVTIRPSEPVEPTPSATATPTGTTAPKATATPGATSTATSSASTSQVVGASVPATR